MVSRVVLVALAVALPAAAQAKTVQVKFCTDLEISFRDGAIGDMWATATSVDARYISTKVVRNDGAVVWSGYASSSGCTPALSLSTTRSYTVTVKSDFLVSNNNQVVVYDDPTSPAFFEWSAAAMKPTASGTKTNTWTYSATSAPYVSNLLAVAHRAIDIQSAGVTDDLFVFFHDPCPGGTGSCLSSTTLDAAHPSWPTVYISDVENAQRSKFVVAHEIGHLVGAMRDEHKRVAGQNDDAEYTTDPTLSVCATGSGHDIESEEWQNTAMNEGLAHFYAAALWNDADPTECDFGRWKPTREITACDESEGWLEDTCYGGATVSSHTANEGDWLSFWWRMHAQEGYSVTELLDAWDAADPSSWSSAARGFDTYSDLRAGGVAAGIDSAVWDSVAGTVGVDH
jgi:hypothetical protein